MPTIEEIKDYRAEIKNKTSEELQSLLDERERYAEWKREIITERKNEINNENILDCANKANNLAESAQIKAIWENRYACISIFIAVIALLVSLFH
jgi:hypothetical protein